MVERVSYFKHNSSLVYRIGSDQPLILPDSSWPDKATSAFKIHSHCCQTTGLLVQRKTINLLDTTCRRKFKYVVKEHWLFQKYTIWKILLLLLSILLLVIETKLLVFCIVVCLKNNKELQLYNKTLPFLFIDNMCIHLFVLYSHNKKKSVPVSRLASQVTSSLMIFFVSHS